MRDDTSSSVPGAQMLNNVIVVNIALLITHQIDAAYWHEWDMFRLPGGIQLFNVLNVLIFMFILGCFVTVIQRTRSGFRCALAIAATSALVLPIHTGFALAGHTEFHLPVSVAIIVGSFVVSVVQMFLVFRCRHQFHQP